MGFERAGESLRAFPAHPASRASCAFLAASRNRDLLPHTIPLLDPIETGLGRTPKHRGFPPRPGQAQHPTPQQGIDRRRLAVAEPAKTNRPLRVQCLAACRHTWMRNSHVRAPVGGTSNIGFAIGILTGLGILAAVAESLPYRALIPVWSTATNYEQVRNIKWNQERTLRADGGLPATANDRSDF